MHKIRNLPLLSDETYLDTVEFIYLRVHKWQLQIVLILFIHWINIPETCSEITTFCNVYCIRTRQLFKLLFRYSPAFTYACYSLKYVSTIQLNPVL